MNTKGYIALISVLIVTAVALTVAISISLSGISEMQMAFSESQSQKTMAYSKACMEEALNRLREDWVDYTGELTFEDGSCDIEIVIGFGDGSDGSLNVVGSQTIDDNRRPLVNGTYNSNSVIIDTGAGAGAFLAGDMVLVIQMSDDNITNNVAGQYEMAIISSVNGNQLNFEDNLVYTYTHDGIDDIVQVLEMPQYTDVTIQDGGVLTANDWDGDTGGILAFQASGDVTFIGAGEINVDEKGYQGGGCGNCGWDTWGQCGEGITGIGSGGGGTPVDNRVGDHTYPDDASNGGAGGYNKWFKLGTAGGGGSNITAGTQGTDFLGSRSDAGNVLIYGLTEKLIFGGGGGGGGSNNWNTPNPIGGDGGGIILMYADEVINANVYSRGGDGIGRSHTISGGTSGAGAGGSIKISARSTSTNNVDYGGGTGGEDGWDYGGDGGDGSIDTTTFTGNAIITTIGQISDDTSSYTRRIRVEVDDELNILSWEELID